MGSRVIQAIDQKLSTRQREWILAIAAGGTPERFTQILRRFAPTHLLLVDAASAGHQAGDIFILDAEQIKTEDMTTHRLPLSLLVRYLRETITCDLLILGIEPKQFSSPRLSRPVQQAYGQLLAFLKSTLEL